MLFTQREPISSFHFFLLGHAFALSLSLHFFFLSLHRANATLASKATPEEKKEGFHKRDLVDGKIFAIAKVLLSFFSSSFLLFLFPSLLFGPSHTLALSVERAGEGRSV